MLMIQDSVGRLKMLCMNVLSLSAGPDPGFAKWGVRVSKKWGGGGELADVAPK